MRRIVLVPIATILVAIGLMFTGVARSDAGTPQQDGVQVWTYAPGKVTVQGPEGRIVRRVYIAGRLAEHVAPGVWIGRPLNDVDRFVHVRVVMVGEDSHGWIRIKPTLPDH